MAAVLTRPNAPATSMRTGFPPPFKKEGVVYAISFDMDIEQLRTQYGDPYNSAYTEIRRILESHQFGWQQGSVYFGSAAVNQVSVSQAIHDLTTRLPWFASCVRDIRVLRIEENNDLMPFVQQIAASVARGGRPQ